MQKKKPSKRDVRFCERDPRCSVPLSAVAAYDNTAMRACMYVCIYAACVYIHTCSLSRMAVYIHVPLRAEFQNTATSNKAPPPLHNGLSSSYKYIYMLCKYIYIYIYVYLYVYIYIYMYIHDFFTTGLKQTMFFEGGPFQLRLSISRINFSVKW